MGKLDLHLKEVRAFLTPLGLCLTVTPAKLVGKRARKERGAGDGTEGAFVTTH